jgi:hypothetical protein
MMVIYASSRTTAENGKTIRHRQISTRSTEASASTASRSVVMANPNWPLIFASLSGIHPKTTTSSTLGHRAYTRRGPGEMFQAAW